MTEAEIQQRVRSYLVDSYLPGEQGESLKNDEDLLKVLNSLQLLRMVIEIEGMFGISIDQNEMTPENLGTIEHISAFVLRKSS